MVPNKNIKTNLLTLKKHRHVITLECYGKYIKSVRLLTLFSTYIHLSVHIRLLACI